MFIIRFVDPERYYQRYAPKEKMHYTNYNMKKAYVFRSKHIAQGLASTFSDDTEILSVKHSIMIGFGGLK